MAQFWPLTGNGITIFTFAQRAAVPKNAALCNTWYTHACHTNNYETFLLYKENRFNKTVKVYRALGVTMVDFGEGTYNISISGSVSNSELCTGNCDCNTEFTAVTFERAHDGSWWFWAENVAEASAGCRGTHTSAINGYVENADGGPVARFVSYYDAPCQNFAEEQYSVVSRGLEFSGIKGQEGDDGRIVFHSDVLNTDLIIVKVNEAVAEELDATIAEPAEENVADTCPTCHRNGGATAELV